MIYLSVNMIKSDLFTNETEIHGMIIEISTVFRFPRLRVYLNVWTDDPDN